MDDDHPPVGITNFEYLDHTADVQLHAWGKNLNEALEQVLISMYGYITDLETIDLCYSFDMKAIATDLPSLLLRMLDQALFAFSTEPFFIGRVARVIEIDLEKYELTVRCWGESFDLGKHPQGADIKAITYSNMQINIEPDRTDIFVIIDI